jgi:predicted nucleic acid-binding Zn ribbon protein
MGGPAEPGVEREIYFDIRALLCAILSTWWGSKEQMAICKRCGNRYKRDLGHITLTFFGGIFAIGAILVIWTLFVLLFFLKIDTLLTGNDMSVSELPFVFEGYLLVGGILSLLVLWPFIKYYEKVKRPCPACFEKEWQEKTTEFEKEWSNPDTQYFLERDLGAVDPNVSFAYSCGRCTELYSFKKGVDVEALKHCQACGAPIDVKQLLEKMEKSIYQR